MLHQNRTQGLAFSLVRPTLLLPVDRVDRPIKFTPTKNIYSSRFMLAIRYMACIYSVL